MRTHVVRPGAAAYFLVTDIVSFVSNVFDTVFADTALGWFVAWREWSLRALSHTLVRLLKQLE